jgi:hypothetical protein
MIYLVKSQHLLLVSTYDCALKKEGQKKSSLDSWMSLPLDGSLEKKAPL